MVDNKINCSWRSILRHAYEEWSEDNALRFSAALSYYAVFSLAPLLIITIALASLVFGEQAARGEIFQQLSHLLGGKAAAAIQGLIDTSGSKPKNALATVLGIITLIIGASGVFGQLKDALNSIWGVRLKPGGALRRFLRDNLLSFGMILSVGFLLIVSLMITTLLQTFAHYMTDRVPLTWAAVPITELFSFILMSVLFALIYKVLPDVELRWQDVRIGALVTSFLFTIGKYLIALYLATSSIGSSFGAAGALVLVLVWIYYSSVTFFFGAEFTKVYSRACGSGFAPSKKTDVCHQRNGVDQGLARPG